MMFLKFLRKESKQSQKFTQAQNNKERDQT